jgi:hypothetical protein
VGCGIAYSEGDTGTIYIGKHINYDFETDRLVNNFCGF